MIRDFLRQQHIGIGAQRRDLERLLGQRHAPGLRIRIPGVVHDVLSPGHSTVSLTAAEIPQ
jgi:hypothetical protein